MPSQKIRGASTRILTTAESLFAQHGFAGVSLRHITVAAKVNLAAVNYHYYDKETLYREILTRRLKQINGRRLDLLAQAESRAGSGPIPLSEIIDALARPLFIPAGEYGASSGRLLGRMLVEQQPFIAELLGTEFQPIMTRFGQAVRRHVPSISPSDFLWRFSYIIGAMHHALATIHTMKSLTNGICRDDDSEGALKNFIEFAVQALGAELR